VAARLDKPRAEGRLAGSGIKLPNGSGRVEYWKRGVGWIEAPDGAFTLDEFMPGACRPVSVRDRARLGMPALVADRDRGYSE
jgi:hypothetical protein